MTSRRKVPATPPADLSREPRDVLSVRPVLWRIHRTRGSHVLPWNGFRTFGPLPSGRFDPHAPPPADQPGNGILYAALSLTTAVAEVFQTTRRVDTDSGAPCLTSWTPSRQLRLLDLTGDWALRNGAAHALAAAPRPTCRTWSRAVRTAWPDLDGLWSHSTMTGEPVVALYEPARSAVPDSPLFSRPLDHPVVWSIVAACAAEIRYAVR